MPEQNIAAVIYGSLDVRVEKWPMPVIGEDDALIKMKCVGICGTDVKFYTSGKCGLSVIKEPTVLGHEGSGVVVKVGANVKSLNAGDRVAIEPTQPCRKCLHCKSGHYNLCPEPKYCSSAGTHGNITRYYSHVADFCHKIPDNLTMEEGASVQPLAICVHACNRAGIKIGTKVVILGAGPIGVLCAMTAKAMGASDIVITDVVQSRLEVAKSLVPCQVLNVQGKEDAEVNEEILKLLGDSPDLAFDACGLASAKRVAMTVTRSGGTVLIVGIGADMETVPLTQAMLREVNIIGSFRFSNSYPAALAAISTGAINLKSFITHHYPIQKIKDALEMAKSGEAIKVIINFDE